MTQTQEYFDINRGEKRLAWRTAGSCDAMSKYLPWVLIGSEAALFSFSFFSLCDFPRSWGREGQSRESVIKKKKKNQFLAQSESNHE